MNRLSNPGRRPDRRRLPAALLSAAAVFFAVAGFARTARSQHPSPAGPKLSFAHGGNAAEVPMELAANAVFVPVRIGQGRSLSWLLDTASPRTMADAALYAASSAAGPNNSPALTLPGLEIRETSLDTHSFDSLGPWYGQRVSGVVGDDVLAHLVVQLNYARLSIELYDPSAYTEPHHTEKLSVRWIDGLPTVRARIRLGGRTVQGNFVLNTGGGAAVALAPEFLAANGMYPYRGNTIPGTIFSAKGDESVSLTRGEWLELGHSQILRPPVAIGSEKTAQRGARKRKEKDMLAGWIGGEILRKFELVLDFPKDRILLVPNRDFIFPVEIDASGATITAAGPSLDQFQVHAVSPGSPAAEAGLEPGDEIAWVDNDPASSLSLDQLRELLSRPGHDPVLVVHRLGRKLKIELHLRRLL